MPLLDHFRPPLADRRDWHSFHNNWATALAFDLNQRLPPEYFADANVQYGIEIDVAVMDEPGVTGGSPSPAPAWTPPAMTAVLPFALETDVAEVRVYRQFGGRQFVGAIELVSPSNKDRPESRAAFVTKCEGYLRGGAGVIVVDVVTTRTANLHDELLAHIGHPSTPLVSPLYAVSYRTFGANGGGRLEFLPMPLALGGALPDLPLWLRGGPVVRVELEQTYQATCRGSRIGA
jgi:hypothetical protein